MATNRHSCAVNVSILLSLVQIMCIVYLAYAITFNTSNSSADKMTHASTERMP